MSQSCQHGDGDPVYDPVPAPTSDTELMNSLFYLEELNGMREHKQRIYTVLTVGTCIGEGNGLFRPAWSS